VNIDSVYPLEKWPDIFRGKSFFLRIDPGTGRGHHQHVRTAGNQSKFGILPESAPKVAELIRNIGATVVGLHAHAGSGILKDSQNWLEVASCLYELKCYFIHTKALNVGGGLGVVQNPVTDKPLDLSIVSSTLTTFKKKTMRMYKFG